MTSPILQPGTHLDLTLTDMAYGGEAVGRAGGSVVFAWGGITGEAVTVTVEQTRRDLVRGPVTAVLAPSPARTVPPCPYFGPCGGCQWQHITYPAQVEFKTHILREQLRRLGGVASSTLERAIQPATGMTDPWHYRNSSTFQVDATTRKLGYYRRDSHAVVPVATCPISETGINDLLAGLQGVIDSHAVAEPTTPERVELHAPVPVALRARPVAGLLHIWQVTIRTGTGLDGTGEGMIVLYTQPTELTPAAPRGRRPASVEPRPAMHVPRKSLRRWVEHLPGRVTVVEAAAGGTLEPVGISPAASAALSDDAAETTMRGAAGKRLYAEPTLQPLAVLRQRLAGQPFWIAPTAFFQVNTAQAQVLVEQVAAALPEPVDLLIDAYCGGGMFALALLGLGRARRVMGIESDPAAVESARWTCHLRHIGPEQAEWHLGRTEDVLPTLDGTPDAVLLDPPRAGCAPAVITHLLERPVPRLIYVSCDPSTLARDVKALSPAYRLVSAQVVDLFPQTFHIETVAVLEQV